MTQDTMTRDRLLDELRNSGREAIERLRALPADGFEKGAYENGWNARQVLAHITGIEWTYPKLIGLAEETRNTKQTPAEKPPEKPNRPAQGGINSYNDRTVERYAGTSIAELLDTFEANRKATIAAVEAADEDLFQVPIRSAGGIPGPLGMVLNYVAVLHVRGHVEDIVQAAGR
jgi:hypothetical protein